MTKKITVVTPTIGKKELIQNIFSLYNQSYKDFNHLIVIDGAKHVQKIKELFKTEHIKWDVEKGEAHFYDENSNKYVFYVCILPHNVGADGFYSHRVIASFSHLINTEYCCFIDEDNMANSFHLGSCMEKMKYSNYDYVYALRSIHDEFGKFICYDECESLGKWPIYGNERNGYMIDTSCYFYRTSFIKNVAHLWHKKWGADRDFFDTLRNKLNHSNFECTNAFTIFYRLGGNENSVKEGFFISGNKIMEEIYNNKKFPWRT